MAPTTTLNLEIKDNASKVLRDIQGSLGAIGKLAGVAFGVKEITQALNVYQDFSNKIKNATNSLQEFSATQSALTSIATKNYTSLSNTADLYARLKLTTSEYNLAEGELIRLTDTLTASFKINNVSAQNQASIIDNLGKSFIKGTIDGRDFNQLLATAPGILQRYSQASGLTINQLQKLAQEGRLSAEGLIQALQNTAAQTEATARSQDVTLGQSLSNLGTQFVLTIGRINEATGLTRGLAIVFDGLGKNIDAVAVAAGVFFTVMAVGKIGSVTNAVVLLNKAFVATRLAILAIPGVGLIAAGLSVAATGAYLLYENLKETDTVSNAIADNWMDYLETGNKVNAVQAGSLSNAEKYLQQIRNSLEPNERLQEIEKARLALGKEYTAEVQKQHETLLDMRKAREIEKAMPALISETQGAYAGGSTEQKALEAKLQLNRDARELDIISEEQYQSNMLILMEEYAIKKRQSQQQSIENMAKDALAGRMSQEKLAQLDSDSKIAIGKSMFGELLGEASKYSEKAFKANKALALANAIMKGYEAIVSAYASGSAIGGPIVGGIFAALAAVTVRGQINAIRSTQYTGARRQGGLVAENQSYLVGEDGPEAFVPSSSGRIIPNDQMGQGVTVNFNISTVDADGFDEILINRRSTIVGIINEATNKRGRVGATQ